MNECLLVGLRMGINVQTRSTECKVIVLDYPHSIFRNLSSGADLPRFISDGFQAFMAKNSCLPICRIKKESYCYYLYFCILLGNT